jgi:hypothetical protein
VKKSKITCEMVEPLPGVKVPKDSQLQIISPPHGSSIREQARWWMFRGELAALALSNGMIPDNVIEAIKLASSDNDLAFKIIDKKKVESLANEERSRLFSLLTDGGEWSGQKMGAPSKAVSDLRMAFDIREIVDDKERYDQLKNAIFTESGGCIEISAIKLRIKRIENLWQQVNQLNPLFIKAFLEACPDDLALEAKKISWLLNGAVENIPEPMIEDFSTLVKLFKTAIQVSGSSAESVDYTRFW